MLKAQPDAGGFPALDGPRYETRPQYVRRGQPVHFVTTENAHVAALIDEVYQVDTGAVSLVIYDETRSQGRYTTAATYDEQCSVGSWHFIEQ